MLIVALIDKKRKVCYNGSIARSPLDMADFFTHRFDNLSFLVSKRL